MGIGSSIFSTLYIKTSRIRFLYPFRNTGCKNNYLIQTDAVKNYIIPHRDLKKDPQWIAYAEEADIVNVALFGFTAKAWREMNPELAKKNNVRDFATIHELTVLSNLETHNAHMIREGKNKEERFQILKEIAEYQLNILSTAEQIIIFTKKTFRIPFHLS